MEDSAKNIHMAVTSRKVENCGRFKMDPQHSLLATMA